MQTEVVNVCAASSNEYPAWMEKSKHQTRQLIETTRAMLLSHMLDRLPLQLSMGQHAHCGGH